MPTRSTLATILVTGFMCWQFGQAGWITAKAELAQWLIADAWKQSLMDSSQRAHKPWQWADTWPVARLQAPTHDADFYVLEGDSGNALAFGPGRNLSSRYVGEGTSVIGGHRDTHFGFLKNTAVGEPLRVQSLSGRWLDYEVRKREIIDTRKQNLQVNIDEQQLILVTCYPFDSFISGGPLRLVVTAALVEPNSFSDQAVNHQRASQYTESSPAIAF